MRRAQAATPVEPGALGAHPTVIYRCGMARCGGRGGNHRRVALASVRGRRDGSAGAAWPEATR